ncbi:MAG: DUF1318 domain-containing protein [Verrucomicrobiota bacterium]
MGNRRQTTGIERCWPVALAVLFTGGLCGCTKPFDVNLATEEPIKVDIDMRVDVHQYGEKPQEEKDAQLSHEQVVERMWARMAEVQELKNNRLVGENRMGLLEIRELPAGDYGEYVSKTVLEENTDRAYLMTRETQERGVELVEVQRQQWENRKQNAFPGEWIEVEGDMPGRYRWVRKEGRLGPTNG